MSDQSLSRVPVTTSPGRTRGVISAIFVLLVGVAAALLLADRYQMLNGSIILAAVAIALATVAIAAFYADVFDRTADGRARMIFDGACASDDHASFLTTVEGGVLARNAAFNAGFRALSEAQAITCLHDVTRDPPGLSYRLLRALRDADAASEIAEAPDGKTWTVHARRLGPKHVIWTLRTIDEALVQPASHEPSARFGVITVDADGSVVQANEAFLARINSTAQEMAKNAAEVLDRGGATLSISANGQELAQCYRFDRPDDLTDLLFLPFDASDISNASPDQVLDSLPVALARVSQDGHLIHANEAARKLLGTGAQAGISLDKLMEGLGRSINDRVRDIMDGRSHNRTEVARAKVSGQEVFLQVTLKRLTLNGEATLLAVINDATELKTLEQQFVQSQKMQAVGQLAGGVAHDFNNLLTAINGHCDLILMRHESTDTDYGDLIQIRHNANRAASLVGQLLAFSRKQTLVPKVIDLYNTLADLNHLMNRLLGEKVSLKIECADDLYKVRVDERQLEQVIMNLVVNARDAMPNGGEVSINTKMVHFEEDQPRDRAVIPFGSYVQIDVSDTGTGIPQDKITKIFEPFFTTKRVGEGTGLGLSTAYGIIKQTGGFIFATSEIGAGTTFTIYLPALDGEVADATVDVSPVEAATDLTGRGVVLLVEDEVPVRSFAARALNLRGYTVLEASTAEEALDILEDDALHVDVFVSDVVMPGMDGPTWVKMAREKRPDTKVIFVSGYAEDAFEGGKIDVPNATFLPKPFSLNELTHTVKAQIEALEPV